MSWPSLNPVFPKPVAEPASLDFFGRPALAIAYLVASGLMEICGPLFWAILAAGFLFAELGLD